MRAKTPILIAAFFLFFAGHAWSAASERLEYDVRWLGIKAGESSLEVTRTGEDRITIISTAVSEGWVDIIYPIRDRAVSVIGTGSGWRPVNYHLKTREGKKRKDREVVFDGAGGKALYIDHLKGTEKEHELPEEIYDPLSAFYVVRWYDLVVGASVYVPMFDSKRVWDVEVKVLRKERIEVPAGTFDTVLIQPLMKSDGIFSRKGKMYIWLTDDEKRIPVRLKSKVKIGSVYAELVGGTF